MQNQNSEVMYWDFYVDDELISLPYVTEAVSMMYRTQKALSYEGLRLYKIVSNSSEVMKHIPVISQKIWCHQIFIKHSGL